jgi:cytochrome c peroxidase
MLAASPFFTHNVGTGDGPDDARLGPAFDTPSLRGLWDSAPYLHDGSAMTLRDVLTTRNRGDQHGRTSHLTELEVEDLISFLRSL